MWYFQMAFGFRNVGLLILMEFEPRDDGDNDDD